MNPGRLAYEMCQRLIGKGLIIYRLMQDTSINIKYIYKNVSIYYVSIPKDIRPLGPLTALIFTVLLCRERYICRTVQS